MGHAAVTVPWYQQRWPWLLIAPPAVAVIGGIVTVVLAVRSSDGVVAADYYKRGLEINAQLDRSRHAAELGLQADVRIDGLAAGDAVSVIVRAEQALPPEAVLALRLVHPGRQSADRVAQLARAGASADGRSAQFIGRWAAPEQPVPEGVSWRLVLEGRTWRLDADASRLDRGALQVRAAQP